MWTRPNKTQISVSPGFLLLLGALFYLDEGVGLLPWCLLACGAHELGHVTAAAFLGGRVEQLSLTVVGAELRFFYPRPLSYGRDCAVALAGPAVNLALGSVALWVGGYLLAVLSVGVGIFNLLPIRPLDGSRILYNLLTDRLGPEWGESAVTVVSAVLTGLLLGVGAIAAGRFANMTLLLTSVWLLWGILGKGRNLASLREFFLKKR